MRKRNLQRAVSSLSRARRGVMIAATLCASTACSGSIEGTVYGTDGDRPVRVTGRPVYLLSTAAEVASVLKSVCPTSAAEWVERSNAERARFQQLAAAYGDSARDELALHRGSRRWTALVRVMNIYRDSASSMDGRQPTISGELVEKLATNRVSTSDDGHYAFANLAPGSYLVVTELRDDVRWIAVQVARRKRSADITPSTSHSGCDVARGL